MSGMLRLKEILMVFWSNFALLCVSCACFFRFWFLCWVSKDNLLVGRESCYMCQCSASYLRFAFHYRSTFWYTFLSTRLWRTFVCLFCSSRFGHLMETWGRRDCVVSLDYAIISCLRLLRAMTGVLPFFPLFYLVPVFPPHFRSKGSEKHFIIHHVYFIKMLKLLNYEKESRICPNSIIWLDSHSNRDRQQVNNCQ